MSRLTTDAPAKPAATHPDARIPAAAAAPGSVLILGANGRFGAAAMQAFSVAGWTVLAQARRPIASLPPRARHVAAGIGDSEALAAAAVGARAVIHAVNPPYTRWATEVLPLARHGMDVAQRLGATFMLPGNVYNFGARMPALLGEDAVQAPTSRKGGIRCELERELQARAATGLRSIVIRAGDFFGGGTGTWLDLAVVKSLSKGKLVYPGPLDRLHAWAYLPDLAHSFVVAAGRSDLPAFTRLHFEGHALTGAELLAAIERAARVLGVAPAHGFRHGSMPWGLIRAGGLLVPTWREVAEMAYLWEVPHALDGSAMRRTLGPLPTTDLDTAMIRTLASLGIGDASAAAAHAHA